jgi:hypothetical protein
MKTCITISPKHINLNTRIKQGKMQIVLFWFDFVLIIVNIKKCLMIGDFICASCKQNDYVSWSFWILRSHSFLL